MEITKDDITLWHGCRWGNEKHNFLIEKLTERILDEEELGYLETFFEDKGIRVDQFNIEYMGCFMGIIYADKETLVNIINEFLKTKFNADINN